MEDFGPMAVHFEEPSEKMTGQNLSYLGEADCCCIHSATASTFEEEGSSSKQLQGRRLHQKPWVGGVIQGPKYHPPFFGIRPGYIARAKEKNIATQSVQDTQ